VRTSLFKPTVVATFKIFHAQEVKVTIDDNGVVQAVNLKDGLPGGEHEIQNQT